MGGIVCIRFYKTHKFVSSRQHLNRLCFAGLFSSYVPGLVGAGGQLAGQTSIKQSVMENMGLGCFLNLINAAFLFSV